jgi:hypothetical protein
MFCSECGQKASGKFCCHCGHVLAPAEPEVAADVVVEWDSEVHYETLMRSNEVRTLIDQHAQMAKKRMTAEQFLALADKLIPQPVSMEGLAIVARPLYAKLGMKVGKQSSTWIAAPVARVIVRALCSLARHGQGLRGVTQGSEGCTIEAELPSDLLSMAGTLLVTIHRQGPGSAVSAETRIEGQLLDWGKSRRALDRLIDDLGRDGALPQAA